MFKKIICSVLSVFIITASTASADATLFDNKVELDKNADYKFAAAYDDSGMLIKAWHIDSEQETLDCDTLTSDEPDAEIVKIFLWKKETLEPVSLPAVIPLNRTKSVKEAVLENFKFNREIVYQEEVDANEDTFKLYYINSGFSVTERYRESGSLRELFAKRYTLNTPVFNKGEVTSTVERTRVSPVEELDLSSITDEEEKQRAVDYAQKYGGTYNVYRTGGYILPEASELFSNAEKATALLEGMGFTEVKEIKYVSMIYDGMHIIYIRTSDNEYAVPYGRAIRFFECENGKLYDMSEFMDILDKGLAE